MTCIEERLTAELYIAFRHPANGPGKSARQRLFKAIFGTQQASLANQPGTGCLKQYSAPRKRSWQNQPGTGCLKRYSAAPFAGHIQEAGRLNDSPIINVSLAEGYCAVRYDVETLQKL